MYIPCTDLRNYFISKNFQFAIYSLEPKAFKKQKPGIRFTEKMAGNFEPTTDKYSSTSCEFTVTIESDDVERMINWDPTHSANISGTVTCASLSEGVMTISQGEHCI